MVFFCLMCTTIYLNGCMATESILFKKHLYIPFFSLFWNHERHDQRNRVTTALGAKQEGLTIVHFWNKLIVSCKEAARFPFYFFLGGGFLNWIVIFYSNQKAVSCTSLCNDHLSNLKYVLYRNTSILLTDTTYVLQDVLAKNSRN